MKRQPAGSSGGGQFAPDMRGKTPPSASPTPATTAPGSGGPRGNRPTYADSYKRFKDATSGVAPQDTVVQFLAGHNFTDTRYVLVDTRVMTRPGFDPTIPMQVRAQYLDDPQSVIGADRTAYPNFNNLRADDRDVRSTWAALAAIDQETGGALSQANPDGYALVDLHTGTVSHTHA